MHLGVDGGVFYRARFRYLKTHGFRACVEDNILW